VKLINHFRDIKAGVFQNKNLFFLWMFQLLSLFGSELTRFALPIWLFQQEENLVSFSLYVFSGLLPRIFSPIFGGLIDCFNKKKILLLSGVISLTVCVLLVLSITDVINRSVFFICFLMFSFGVCGNLIHIGTLALVTQIVEKDRLFKANSLMIAAESSAVLICPVLSGSLILAFDFLFVVLIDMLLFVISLMFLMKIDVFSENRCYKNIRAVFFDVKNNLIDGVAFIKKNGQIAFLMVIFGLVNFFFSFSFVLFTPMVLSISQNNTQLLGSIYSIGNGVQLLTSFLAGYFLKSNSQIALMMRSIILMGVCGPLLIGMGSSPVFWTIGYAATLAFLSIINATNNAFWQTCSPLHLQGSIFGIRRMVSSLIAPIGTLLAGPLINMLSTSSKPKFIDNEYQLVFLMAGFCILLTGVLGSSLKKIKQTQSAHNE